MHKKGNPHKKMSIHLSSNAFSFGRFMRETDESIYYDSVINGSFQPCKCLKVLLTIILIISDNFF